MGNAKPKYEWKVREVVVRMPDGSLSPDIRTLPEEERRALAEMVTDHAMTACGYRKLTPDEREEWERERRSSQPDKEETA